MASTSMVAHARSRGHPLQVVLKNYYLEVGLYERQPEIVSNMIHSVHEAGGRAACKIEADGVVIGAGSAINDGHRAAVARLNVRPIRDVDLIDERSRKVCVTDCNGHVDASDRRRVIAAGSARFLDTHIEARRNSRVRW